MLVYKRFEGQSVDVALDDGRTAKVTVLQVVDGRYVRLGFDFPRDVPVSLPGVPKGPLDLIFLGASI